MKSRLLIALLLLAIGVKAAAQDSAPGDPFPPTGVYVTTQDFSSFRTGPGTGFDRLAVVPPVVMLPAYGRTSDTRWVQVIYEGRLGWIAARLLVWSGDMIDLPVDGVNPVPFVRRAAALGVTTRETPIYATQVTPEDQVGVIPEATQVELTGRLGDGRFFRFQVRHQGQLYWVGSWNIRVIEGDYRRLLDLAYLYPYGRLVLALENNLALGVGSYSQILGVWQRLKRGDQVACLPIPPRVERLLTDDDVRKEPAFLPATTALDNAIAAINSAISAFEDACNNPNVALTVPHIDAQLAQLDAAERNLILTGSLLEPLRRRNPLLGNPAQ